MIDTTKAVWELTDNDIYAIKWLNKNGFDVVLKKQYISKTIYIVKKNNIEDKLSIPKGANCNIKSYMMQYESQFDLLYKLTNLKIK